MMHNRKARLPAVALAALALAGSTNAADLSPGRWPAGYREEAEKRSAIPNPVQLRTVRGKREMIAATAPPLAIAAGMRTLSEGGTAADAAIVTALMQVSASAGANVSFAGAMQFLYFEAATGKIYALDAGWSGWKGERHPETIPATDMSLALTGRPGEANGLTGKEGRMTLVPGFMLGLEAAQKRFGKFAFRDLLAPSIWYAEQGVPTRPVLQYYFNAAQGDMGKTPEGRAFLDAGKASERFVVPGLAHTLRNIAKSGAREMYTGEWGRNYVAAIKAAGGAASMADLAAYKPQWIEPMSVAFDGGRVFTPTASEGGSCWVLEALNLLEHMPVGGNYWEDAATFRAFSLSLRFAQFVHGAPSIVAFEQRAGVGGGCAARLDPAYGAAVAPALEQLLSGRPAPVPQIGEHSASVVVVDRWGNVAVIDHSSNTALWGSTGLVVGGVPIPAPATVFREPLSRMGPGVRVPANQTPLIMLRNGKPVLALAHIGVSGFQEILRLVAGLRTATAEQVAVAPPLFISLDPTPGPLLSRPEPVPPGAYSPELLAKLGLPVRELPPQQVAGTRGTVSFVVFDEQGMLSVEVPRVNSFAEGR